MTKKAKNAITVILVLAIIMGMIAFAANTVRGLIGTTANNINTVVPDNVTPAFSLKGKSVSFLGDSISTYEGWSNNTGHNSSLGNNATKYNNTIMNVNSTWWKQTINELQLSLCVNNSCDAGRVTNTKLNLPNGFDRAGQLHRDNSMQPDIIIVYLGTNDLGNKCELGSLSEYTINYFIPAYDLMLCNIVSQYPGADVFVCTLLPEGRNTEDKLIEYNAAIKQLAALHKVNVIDLYADSGINRTNYLQYVINEGNLTVHPNEDGMDLIADCVVKALIKFYE